MVCYIIPTVVFLLHSVFGKNKKTREHEQFSLLMGGGALFGIMDHAWNNQLFFISSNWVSDAALGIIITLGISGTWALLVWKEKIKEIAKKNAFIPLQ